MTLGGGIGESSRYNMLDEIQAFSIPRACWNTICIFIFSGFVWSHRRRQKGGGPAEAHNAVTCVCVRRLLYFTVHALRFLFIQIYLCLCQCLRLGYLHLVVGGGGRIHLQSGICNCSSIHATDLYPPGSRSSDLDKYIQSQETKAIPPLCPLLALDQ